MKKIKFLLIINVLMITVSCLISVYATSYLYNSSEVSFNNTSTGITSDNAQGAIDQLYESANDYATIESLIYPVGSIYISVTDSTVSAVQSKLGGTWEKFAEGKTLVGVYTSDTDFNTVLKTGGSKTHRHEHGDLRAQIGAFSGTTTALGYVTTGASDPATGASAPKTTYGISGSTTYTSRAFNHYTPVLGYVNTKSSLQPYITAYIYRRIA